MGYYHHLILKLQQEYDLELSGVIDFAYPRQKTSLSAQKSKSTQSKLLSDEIRQCAVRIIHRSLICLGDLARYRLDLDPNWDPMIAARYYKTAVSVDPTIGMPHNQLGTVAGNRNYGLDAVYHYTRCMLCTESFEGAEGNLRRIITTHSYTGKEKFPFQKCAARLFSLLQLWDSDSPDSEQINHDCQDLLVELENCLGKDKTVAIDETDVESEDSIEALLQNCRNNVNPRLTDDMIFKIVAICLMSISKLKSKESGEVQGAIAFTLTILSQLMQVTITRLQDAVMDTALPNGANEGVDVNKRCTENYESDELEAPKENCNGDVRETVVKTSNASRVDLNDNRTTDFKRKVEKTNGTITPREAKKIRDKSKSLLTKLRRPRKRLNSSDSEASDLDGPRAGSSSDEMNSDISETEEEEDALSECNEISDDPLSEDLTDDELGKSTANFNGHPVTDKETNCFSESNVNSIKNGDDNANGTVDKKIDEDCAIENSGEAITVNNDGACEESGDSNNTVTHVALLKKQSLDPKDILKILGDEGSLRAIKICFDWLRGNPDIFRMFAKSSSASLKRVAALLNLVNIVEVEVFLKNWDRDTILSSSVEGLMESSMIVPLPEDIDMRGLKLLEEAHKSLDWTVLRHTKMLAQEETLLRVSKLVSFGKYVCSISDSGIKFDEDRNLFMTSDVKNASPAEKEAKTNGRDTESEQSRGKLMRHMGKLWLKAEVRALESRLRSRLISPYLVPDQEALAKHTPALKRLVYAKKFIVIIPSVGESYYEGIYFKPFIQALTHLLIVLNDGFFSVVSALDEMKRTSSKAREATRWLEAQLRKGSRFLRAQRPHERLPLPLIKGPKTKDKEAWLFFQIIECCHYLTQQTKVGLNGDKEPPVVTLLTGLSVEERKASSFSTDGLTKTAGTKNNIRYYFLRFFNVTHEFVCL